MKKNLALLTVLISIAICTSCKAQQLELTTNGTANYVIATAGDIKEDAAAKILQVNLQKISGAVFNINQTAQPNKINVLTVNDAKKNFPALQLKFPGEEGVLIQTSKKDLFIIGGDGNGLNNAVYEFLEKYLGCRYYTSDAINIPSQKTITVPATISYAYTPLIKYRFIFGGPAFKGDYAAWNKLHNLQNNKNAPPGWGLFVHSMFTLVPPDKYFKDHPEYYALINGKRVATQLDLTNPDVLKVAQTALADIIQKNPNAKYFSVSQMDNNGYCQCDNCKRKAIETGSQSGVIINFVNKLAIAFPGITISTLAYDYSRAAPTNISPVKNVNILFCATGVNRSISFAADQSKGSVYNDLQAWAKVTNNMFFWDYIVDFRHLYMPFPVWHVLKPNMQFVTKNNVDKLIVQSWTYNGSDMTELKTYLVAQLLWNPDIDIQATQNEFIKFYYGGAAPYISKYINDLTTYIQANKTNLTVTDVPLDHINDFLSPEQIKIYSQDFDNATKAVNNNAVYLDRVQNAQQSLRYAILDGTSKLDANVNDTNSYLKMVQDFKTTAVKAQVGSMDIGGSSNVDDFVTDQEVYQKNKFINNLAAGASATINNATSPINNLSNLFDKIAGNKTPDNKWVTFQQPSVEMIIDLKKQINIDSISAKFMHNPQQKIQLPVSIKYSASNDGKTYTDIGIAKNLWAGMGVKEELKTFTLNLQNKTSARYIKMSFTSVAPFAADGLPQTMLCDEIIVR